VPSPTVPLALTPGGTLEIRVGAQTLAKGGAQGRLLTAAGVPYAYSLFAPEGTIALGTPVRRLPNVAPGNYTLTVDGATAKSFNVTEGGATIVELP